MSDLTDFLRARIAEDAARVDTIPMPDVVLNSRGEVSARGEGWVTRGDCPICGHYMSDGTESVTEVAWWEHMETYHARTRVLAECQAKRRIVAVLNRETPVDLYVLRALADPYADHPDFREEWRA